MKRFYQLFVCAILLLTPALLNAQKNEKPFVIPELQEWKGGEGFFNPAENTAIVYNAKSKGADIVAAQFAEDYFKMFGKKLNITSGKPKKGDFYFTTKKDKKIGNEGYTINISTKVEISANTQKGLYWASRTLLQLSEQNNLQAIPQGNIKDFPNYELRGFMLDCGRKFFPMSFLRDYVKFMSYYKMNTFQIHLNDNGFKQFFGDKWENTYSAFRMESETFPGLTARDGHYTKKEFIELQKYADSLGIEIIPEIDIPAHSLAFSMYKPEIGSKEYGIDHLDLFKEETYQFVDALLKEYLEGENPVFCGKRVHIGTDEYSNKKKDVVEKFRYFTNRYINYIESFGKQPCVWGALTHAKGETPVKVDNVLMNAWYNGYAEPRDMIKLGYDLVSIPDGYLYIVPLAGYYYDYLNNKFLYDSWTPAQIGKEKFEEKHPQIKGGMFAVWNDHVGNGISTKDVHYRVLPAMQTLSGKMWKGSDIKLPFEEFDKLRTNISEGPGLNIAGKVGKKPEMVYSSKVVSNNMETGIEEIGYSYTVSFKIKYSPEEKGSVLFSSPYTTFYLAEPTSGRIGFARDGYLNTFEYRLYPNQEANVSIVGDQKSTSLFIDGKLVEKLDVKKKYFNEKVSMNYISTLVFPLEKAGNFKSKITDLEVYNYCK